LGEIKIIDTPSIDKRKRPLGLTIISIVWLFAGFINIYFGYETIIMDLEVLPFLNDPSIHEWFQFGVPAELAISFVMFILGFIQIITIYGLLTAKSWSYKLALLVPILNALIMISLVALYWSAPMGLGFRESADLLSVGFSIFWVIIYWSYLRQSHVKEYLGVTFKEAKTPSKQEGDGALKILRIRLAKGEITKKEYEEIKESLEES
jgi:hypothetical protein